MRRSKKTPAVTENPWQALSEFTDARIGLGRAGISIPTKHSLAFQLAHAQAQDAVHAPLDSKKLSARLAEQPWCKAFQILTLHSQATDRSTYLQRPDLGRQLDDKSRETLQPFKSKTQHPFDLVIVIADGLSALAIEENVEPLLNGFMEELHKQNDKTWNIGPICLVNHARVAVGDDISECLNARSVLVLIGERPGLSSPDSLGIYLTYNAKVGTTDAHRNCISNIRPAGLHHDIAAQKLRYLLSEAHRRQLTGVELKERTEESVNVEQKKSANFLIKKT